MRCRKNPLLNLAGSRQPLHLRPQGGLLRQAAVPGGSIQRVETDAEGSPYEAHMTKSDGTRVTVKVDKDFKVTKIESDGAGPGGPRQSGGTSTTTA